MTEKTVTVALTAKELRLLRQGICWSSQHAYAEAMATGFCTPAVNSELDQKLYNAQQQVK
jgi:hypothetical protein